MREPGPNDSRETAPRSPCEEGHLYSAPRASLRPIPWAHSPFSSKPPSAHLLTRQMSKVTSILV